MRPPRKAPRSAILREYRPHGSAHERAIMSKCFVSFSSRDTEFAGKLVASFRLQNVDVWDYSNYAQDIPLGESVKSRLCKQIDDSAHFVAVVSGASADRETGKFPRFEWQYAHKQGKRILPVVIQPFSPANLDSELEFLEDTKYLPFEASDADDYERSFARLCEEMAVPYEPPFLGDPRVVFAPRFDREVRGLAIPADQRVLLRTVIDRFGQQYRDQKWADAGESITFFMGATRWFIKGAAPYYPALLLALCKMHEGRLDDALLLLTPLFTHPLADENVWAAVGQIHFLRREFEKALAMFTVAKQKCPPGEDWEARFNILATCLELGRLEEASAAFSGFDLESRPVDDQVKIANLQATIFSRANDWCGAIEALQWVYDGRIGNASSAIQLAKAYERSAQAAIAVQVLTNEAERLQDNNLYHHLAALYMRLRAPVRALEIYRQRLISDPDRPAQMMTDYALILRSLGQRAESLEVCQRAIALPRPTNGSEFYFRGLAHYLLGHQDYARALYEESKAREPYYSEFA
jgi:tetratricopeptide (TPR) repeat protein